VERFRSFIVILFELFKKDIVMTAVEKNTVIEIATAADLTLKTVAGRMKSIVAGRPLVAIGIAAGCGADKHMANSEAYRAKAAHIDHDNRDPNAPTSATRRSSRA
jgi:hypothetical protein